MGNETIKKAIDRGVDIVLYGHTHRPVIDIDDDIIAVNPGSLSYPRQEGRQPSYAIMEIDREEKYILPLHICDNGSGVKHVVQT